MDSSWIQQSRDATTRTDATVLKLQKRANDLENAQSLLKTSMNQETSSRFDGFTCVAPPEPDFVFRHARFLPPRTAPRPGTDPLVKTMLREMKARQEDKSACETGESLIVSYLPSYGLSAVMLYQPRGLSVAAQMGRTYAVRGAVAGAAASNSSSMCPTGDLSCVYEPWSACGQVYNPPAGAISSHPQGEAWSLEDQPRLKVPEPYAERGWFWWTAHALQYLTRPNARLQEMVKEAKATLRWTHPMIGMHVRRSDSCRTRATCKPLDEYFKAAEEMQKLYGVRNVYVATDGSEVIEEIKTGKYDDKFDIRYLEWDRSGFDWMRDMDRSVNVWLEPCHEKGICDGIADMFSMAVDYELLADADYHIGMFTSGAFRVPYALSLAKKGCYTPYISLDISWCWAWGTMMESFFGMTNVIC